MEKLKGLQFKRLLKELEYIESDFEYRSEVISGADSEFIKSINSFLENHPELKEIYDKKINDRINQTIKNQTEINKTERDGETGGEISDTDEQKEISNKDEVNEDIKDKNDIPPKIKKLYREIVKLTHPDKVKRKKLNDLYIKATNYYNLIDKVGIYRICNELDIDYELEDEDQSVIDTKISDFKNRITFLESTFTWKWFTTEDEMEKNQILIDYIKRRLQ